MAMKTTFLILIFLLSGCAGKELNESDVKLDIGKVHIDTAGKSAGGGTAITTQCSGFILSEKEVRNFLMYASRVKDDGADKYYRVLPCSATGTAVINRRKYRWLIRDGGIGELSSKGGSRFVTTCGKQCCDKVPGLC